MFSNNKRPLLSKLGKNFSVVMLCGIIFASGWFLGQNNPSQASQSKGVEINYQNQDQFFSDEDINFSLYWSVYNELKKSFVDKDRLNDKDFFYGSIKGLVASLGDPYTSFMDPEDNKKFKDDLAGTFEGIGAEIGLRDEVITIIAPLNGMPAEKAGLRAGDKIFAINGTSTMNMSVDQAVSLIRGPKDTSVTLNIFRQGEKETRDINITRGLIKVDSVKTEILKNNILLIEISAFNDDTWDLFDKAVKEAKDKKVKGIILDLRNNPGGYLDTAVDMASEWVEEGTIVIEKFGDGREEKYFSSGAARLKGIPTVVLTNGGSASASEIVAGALKDYKLATLVGEKTYGKGSVQTLSNFNDGSSVKITIAKWLTPEGKSIDEEGIEPNEKIELNEEDLNQDKDPQLDKALEILTK